MLFTIKVYEKKDKTSPYYEWLDEQEGTIQNMIRARLTRMSLGNFGKSEPVGEGVSELKINVGPGYRIYYCLVGGNLVVLILCVGTKKTQAKDIKNAKDYLKEYKMRGK
jgi:putative addiction module killer protein